MELPARKSSLLTKDRTDDTHSPLPPIASPPRWCAMTTIRRRKPRFGFVQILNAVARDYRVSWRARGLLTELLSYPEDYETSVDELVKKAKRLGGNVEGRDAMRKAARELKDVGYIVETKYQNELGHWITEHEITDDPMYDLIMQDEGVSAGQADDGFSGVGGPGVGGPGVNKKTEKKTEKNILPPTPSGSPRSRSARAGREDEISSKKTTARGSEAPRARKARAPRGSGPVVDSEAHGRAQALIDDAVSLWPRGHRAPSARDRQRLAERIVAELGTGGTEEAILHELTRDMADAGQAMRVIMGDRTTVPGWGRLHDPRPDHSRYEVRTGTPWCGTCDERTRQVVVRSEDGGSERMARCRRCHPEAEPRPEPEQLVQDVTEDADPEEIERMRASLAEQERAARERKEAEVAATKALLAAIQSGADREERARLSRR